MAELDTGHEWRIRLQNLTYNPGEDTEFLLSLLQAGPSARDSRKYLDSFSVRPPAAEIAPGESTPVETQPPGTVNPLVTDLLSHTARRPALVKIQGPFTDVQLEAVAKGMAYLQKLGLVSIIIVDRDDIGMDEHGKPMCPSEARRLMLREVERTTQFLVKHRAPATPVLSTVVKIRQTDFEDEEGGSKKYETYVEDEGLDVIRRAVEEGEIPVLMPVAMDELCKSQMVGGNDVIRALVHGMTAKSQQPANADPASPVDENNSDITPLRLLIINREGGIPSYARAGMPHLSINLESEYDFIQNTFSREWASSHPTALSNLTLARDCLEVMPPSGSALIVSHKSPAALIANLITNKPAHSASLPHALLVEGEGKITRHTPTLIRKGLPVRIVRSVQDIDRAKLTRLLEKSFRRTLNEKAFYARLEKDMDFLIVAGDYAGAALCTFEGRQEKESSETLSSADKTHLPICYLDKFAVLPSHQGDGTVDFLWVALRDETFGLGLKDAANANIGSLSGVGTGRDLVWRSRGDNPVNKWYYERSNGFTTRGSWKMFWCDAEQRIRGLKGVRAAKGDKGIPVKVVEDEEHGRLEVWGDIVEAIPSAWSK
ncbi:hypothetical protein QFC20_001764 [Naganishia adeliensis]|uniref:Uncharacterized protein n=1 Tax=Naganishia adeliensis TaxID=92952 RepID=A0ACC2WPP6_9TREE|nr:hypothetical protein QFC20_001764 [Naganishia adeliensis]